MANENIYVYSSEIYPANYPVYMSGKLTYKVKLKKDFVRADGTCAVYIQVFLNGKKMIPLNFSSSINNFDDKKQRLKASHPYCKDYNLLIEKKLADINTIEVNYRLSNKILTLDNLMTELNNPTSRIDFIKFWTDEMIRQKEILKSGTYRQQMTMLNKVKEFKNPLFFYEITEDFVQDLKTYCKKKLKNTDSTISSLLKSFKKYLHIANKKGISTPVRFDDIKNKAFKGNRTYLTPEEINKMYKFWSSEFISDTYKNILSRFLFSCFTGLRFSDIQNLTQDNFTDDLIVFTTQKTTKFQRIPLNNSAKKFIGAKKVFQGDYTGEYINRELKEIAKFLKIQKKISYHVSRHSFATNFLLCGGRVEVLQKILGHSKILDTMIYVHIVDEISDVQIMNMDDIITEKPQASPLD
jgi:integrase/recombinase XerD